MTNDLCFNEYMWNEKDPKIGRCVDQTIPGHVRVREILDSKSRDVATFQEAPTLHLKIKYLNVSDKYNANKI